MNFGTFVTLFPQLIAGPIIKYKDLADQMAFRTHSPEKFASGVQIFIVGLGKMVLLANNIGQLWDVYLATPGTELTTLGAWLGILAFSLQLYFDFSGYSDMAVGMGRMLGFQFLENFNYPYLAKSATEFWRRWHISLGSWFREYLYIPLGGNRVKAPRMVFNLFVVWACTGIWHGASWNFLIWGLYYFVIIVFERFFFSSVLDKLPGWVGHVYGLFIVMVRCSLWRTSPPWGSISRQCLAWAGRACWTAPSSTICAAICPSSSSPSWPPPLWQKTYGQSSAPGAAR